MYQNVLSNEQARDFHKWFKSKLAEICQLFDLHHLGEECHPEVVSIQVSALEDLAVEMRSQLKTPKGQKWQVTYTHVDGVAGTGMCSHYDFIPEMIEELIKMNCTDIVVSRLINTTKSEALDGPI